MKKSLIVILMLTVVFASLCAFTACRDVGNGPGNTGDGENDTLSPYVLASNEEQSARQQYLQIHQSYIDEGATIENVIVKKCYGQINGKIVLSFDWISSENFVLFRISVPAWPMMISDVRIDMMQCLALLYNGKVYTLEDAFEQSILNHSELETIAFESWSAVGFVNYGTIGEK